MRHRHDRTKRRKCVRDGKCRRCSTRAERYRCAQLLDTVLLLYLDAVLWVLGDYKTAHSIDVFDHDKSGSTVGDEGS